MDRDRFAVSLLTLTGPTDLDSACADLALLHLGSTRKVAPFFFWRLKEAIKKLNPDILVPCTALPNIWGRIWGKSLKTPVSVGTCRGGGAPMRQHERFLWRLADHIVCNSEASVQAMRNCGTPKERLSYIPNGIDTDFYMPGKKQPSSSPLILCVCRLSQDKDLATLIKAFELAWRQKPGLRLRLVGEGPKERELREFVNRKIDGQAAKNIEFAGASSQPLRHYQEADIFALSSIREGQPNVIMEAMSCALPVCATNAGGIPGLVDQDKTGLLSPVGQAEAMAENLLELANNPSLAQDMGIAGREKIKNNFSFSNMVASHERLFDKLWEKHIAKV